jgi:CheY-like chemotaxis protein
MYPRTVLVVDDDPIIRICLADALLDEGFEVVRSFQRTEAVAVFGAHNVDCVVTDVDMPGDLDGLRLGPFRQELQRSNSNRRSIGRKCAA